MKRVCILAGNFCEKMELWYPHDRLLEALGA